MGESDDVLSVIYTISQGVGDYGSLILFKLKTI